MDFEKRQKLSKSHSKESFLGKKFPPSFLILFCIWKLSPYSYPGGIWSQDTLVAPVFSVVSGDDTTTYVDHFTRADFFLFQIKLKI
jgi:hypothetical protein